jgi:hypothetical protein
VARDTERINAEQLLARTQAIALQFNGMEPDTPLSNGEVVETLEAMLRFARFWQEVRTFVRVRVD